MPKDIGPAPEITVTVADGTYSIVQSITMVYTKAQLEARMVELKAELEQIEKVLSGQV